MIFAGWTKESNMPATYLHLSGADIERNYLLRMALLKMTVMKRRRTKTCCIPVQNQNLQSMLSMFDDLGSQLSVEVQDVKTEALGQIDNEDARTFKCGKISEK